MDGATDLRMNDSLGQGTGGLQTINPPIRTRVPRPLLTAVMVRNLRWGSWRVSGDAVLTVQKPSCARPLQNRSRLKRRGKGRRKRKGRRKGTGAEEVEGEDEGEPRGERARHENESRNHRRWRRTRRQPTPDHTPAGQSQGECLPGACPAHYLCIKYLISSPKFIPT